MENLFNEIPEALIAQYMKVRDGETFVIKFGGELFEDEEKLNKFIQSVKFLVQHHVKVVLVHGSGPQTSKIVGNNKRDGQRITPPEKMTEIQSVCTELSKRIASLLAKYEPVILPPKLLQSEQRGFDNATADITGLDPALQKLAQESSLLIASNIGVDNKTSEFTNINADNVAGAIALELEAAKLFFIGKTNGVLEKDKKTTIPEIHPDSIDPQSYEDGMSPKMGIAKEVAQANIPVHLVSWDYPGDVVRESFVPTGIPERATMISKVENPEEWVTLTEDNPLQIEQLKILLDLLKPFIEERTEEYILQNLENFITLWQNSIIKCACEIKKHSDEIHELGAFAVPCFLENNGLGKEIFEQFEIRRKEDGVPKGCAIIKAENKKAFDFFCKKAKQKPFPSWFPEERETKERIYFEWE